MFTPIQLDKTRNLRYGMRALSMAEDIMNKPIMTLDLNQITIRDVATLLWCGLVHEDNDLNVDKVMDLLDECEDFQTVFATVGKALEEAFAGKNQKNAQKVAAKKQSHGA
jgi:hypothetical protein